MVKEESMSSNLLRPGWEQLDSHELRLLLDARIGGPGQYDSESTDPNRIYLPLARENCRVVLTFSDKRIVGVEPGQAFDAAEWNRVAEEIEASVLVGPTKVGREYSFSSYRVQGSWRGERSGVQILPPKPDAARPDVEDAEHPFILEFPLQVSPFWPLTNHRRRREHRRLTLLLNTLLAGRTNLQPRRSNHFWGCFHRDGSGQEIRWVHNAYFAQLGKPVLDSPSPATCERLEEIAAERYYSQVTGLDGLGLRVPTDLDDSICQYQRLDPARRDEFDRAAFWLDMASRQWNTSVSASFAALVSAVEALINTRGPGSTARFRAFFERYAPDASLSSRRDQMYDVRSGILHGSDLMTIDQDIDFGWDPPWWNERELNSDLWAMTRIAVRNWLKDKAGPRATSGA